MKNVLPQAYFNNQIKQRIIYKYIYKYEFFIWLSTVVCACVYVYMNAHICIYLAKQINRHQYILTNKNILKYGARITTYVS